MRLEGIRLENFRQFYGEQYADFSIANDLNVTVFHGLNGTGKTSLFSAVIWCLYESGVDDIGELVSKRALSEAAEGSTVTTKVGVMFLHKGSRYAAKRTLEVRKTPNGGVPTGRDFSLTRISASGDAEALSNPVGHMNAILPANVRPYFFFDGEKMDNLTRANSQEVRDAIRNVMRLPALERAEDHLNAVAAEFRREVKRQGSPEVEKLISREEKLRAEKQGAVRRREALRDEVRLARQQIAELEARLREKEATKALQERRDRAQAQLGQLEDDEREKIQALQQLANRLYLNFLGAPAERALVALDEKREKGEIPSGIREQFLKDLLDTEPRKCICGRPFEAHDDVYACLEALLNRSASSRLESEVLRLAGQIRSLSTIASTQTSALNAAARDLARIRTAKDQLYRELDDLKRQLTGTPEEEIAGLERRRVQFQRSLEKALTESGSIERQIATIEQQIADLTLRKQKAEAAEKKLALLTRKEALAQRAADAVARIKDEFFEQTRRAIEEATRKVFAALAWKQDHFQDIRLDRDFCLEVIDRWGMPTRKELSAGERQILSLSFICAMAMTSKEEAPLVMDTPFGRLSGNHLAAVAQNLPSLAPQLVLFVTDREWDEASKTGLEPRAGAQYELQFDPATSCTRIVEAEW